MSVNAIGPGYQNQRPVPTAVAGDLDEANGN